MTACITCNKSLVGEKVTLVFKLLGMGFCEACMMGEDATKIMAGLVERKRIEQWGRQ